MKIIQGRLSEYLFAAARFVREPHYGHKVFLRGLIEFTNYCKKRLLLLWYSSL